MRSRTILRKSNAFRSLSLLVALLFLIGCASTNVPPIGAGPEPFRLAADERQLWQMSLEEEQKLEESGKLYHDPMLQDYLNDIGQRLIPENVKREDIGFRFAVIDDPALNAFTFPNGGVYMHTGLIARLENEAQLAHVLAHEITHVVERHPLRYYRDARNKQLGLTLAGIAASIGLAALGADQAEEGHPVRGAVIAQTGQVFLQLGLHLALLASVNGYGRELETSADDGGMRLMTAAGYDPKEIPRIFAVLMEESEDAEGLEHFFYGSHPTNRQRLERTQMLLATDYAGFSSEPTTVVNTEEFQWRTRVLVREDARLNIEAGRFERARMELDRVLSLTPNDPTVHCYYGEWYRLGGGGAPMLAEAEQAYRQALYHKPEYPDAHKGLALVAYKLGDNELAIQEFKKYLSLRPDAEDYSQVENYLIELGATHLPRRS